MPGIPKLKFKRTTISSAKYPAAANLLNQNFKACNQNHVWVSDITYIRTEKDRAYLTVIIDLCDRKVISWSLSETMKTVDTTIAAFKQALRNRPLSGNQKLIFISKSAPCYTISFAVFSISQIDFIFLYI